MNKRPLAVSAAIAAFALAAAPAPAQEVEEIVVVGSQIRGAQITDALPVSIIDQIDIEALGVNSGDELLEFVVEQGQNYFSESENISGGVNSARGDIGAFNLRNIGTGNTLVLMNGRRMVNSAAYQTEEVGGSFVPVNSVNAQSIPGTGIRRVEVLRDGASAIYGADAVAGVTNYVMRDDFDGLRVRVRADDYEDIPRKDQRLTLEWGTDFNGGATSVGAYFSHFTRDRVNSQDDERWADSDFRWRVEDPDLASTTIFRNNSVNSNYGQYDIRSSVSDLGLTGTVTDRSGEFETYPAGDDRCEYPINALVCGAPDGQGTYRFNLNTNRDLYSKLDRSHLYGYLNHDFDGGAEFFSEFSWYYSDTNTIRHPSAALSAVGKLRMAPDAYYNPFGPCGSPNRLPESLIGAEVPCEGLELEIDNYRYAQVPRIVDVDGDTYRLVAGLRGDLDGVWDWEGALVWSRSARHDVTHNRISNTLMTEALRDPTPAGFNPFAPHTDSNIERTLVDVTRDNEQELTSVDFKLSNPDIYELPAGPLGFFVGFEYRDESFSDDRDSRLDGSITFTDVRGTTYPFISDVMNSSPTADNSGDRQVTSLFTELAVPVFDTLDLQLAVRYEDFSDVGATTVGKAAFGWRPAEQLLIRGSWSEAFRAPNLITINEALVARSNTRSDFACFAVDPDETVLDCRHGVQRTAQGSRLLVPEESENTSIGFVLEPVEGLTITFDRWQIDKTDTIGLFGEENHTSLDLLLRLQHGASNCGSAAGNPAVVRSSEPPDPESLPLFEAAGICPFGQVERINDQYANLDVRNIVGRDLGVYYVVDTDIGNFDFRYLVTWMDKYDQEASGDSLTLAEAAASGALPDSVPVTGFESLLGVNGNPESKQSLRLRWDRGDWGASLTGLRYAEFVQVLSNNVEFPIPEMTTYNMNVSYGFEIGDVDALARFGVNNIENMRAPLADDSFGYFADQHRDLGRYYYLDLRLDLF